MSGSPARRKAKFVKKQKRMHTSDMKQLRKIIGKVIIKDRRN